MAFVVEHIGIMAAAPLAMAAWYERVLGFETRASSENGGSANAFVADAGGTMLEFGKNPGAETLAERLTDPLQFHIALKSDDIEADALRLAAEGAIRLGDVRTTAKGDRLLLLKDPWGNTLQLAQRAGKR